MARGFKTGGRSKGTPNRKTLDVIERLDQLGCDPIEGMATIAMDDSAPIEVRARMFSELATYVAPKRRAVEHSAAEGAGAITFSWLPSNASAEMVEGN
jgi:hypothetical protein